jgi:dihydroxyacid dehydratase/phosphogluconate dehydratase
MTVHAAFGGSTNLLLHVPAIAFAAGLRRPTVEDWAAVNRRTPRLVDVLPNGPSYHPTIRAYLAGGVPEVMLHLRTLGLLDLSVLTVTGRPMGEVLDEWAGSDRRTRLRERLIDQDGVDPDDVIMPPELARARGLTSTVTFPRGNLAPEGSFGKEIAVVTDARFSGVSTGACIGHVGPEALAGGPIGKLRDGDTIRIVVDRIKLEGSVDLVGAEGRDLSPEEAALLLIDRAPHPDLAPDPELPGDTRLWAALQAVGGGTWGGCVYDVEAIVQALEAGRSDKIAGAG